MSDQSPPPPGNYLRRRKATIRHRHRAVTTRRLRRVVTLRRLRRVVIRRSRVVIRRNRVVTRRNRAAIRLPSSTVTRRRSRGLPASGTARLPAARRCGIRRRTELFGRQRVQLGVEQVHQQRRSDDRRDAGLRDHRRSAQFIFGFLSAAVSPDSTTYVSDDSGFSFSYNVSGPASLAVTVIGWIVALVVGGAIQSAYYSGMLDVANGRPVSIGSFFKPRNVGSVIVASLIVGVLTSIGFALCILPGLVVAIFTLFTVIALLDRNLSPIDAIKTSFDIAKNNFGQVLLTFLVLLVVAIVGALLCGVGLLVAIPLIALIEVYAYRKLSGGQVAEADQQQVPPGPQTTPQQY